MNCLTKKKPLTTSEMFSGSEVSFPFILKEDGILRSFSWLLIIFRRINQVSFMLFLFSYKMVSKYFCLALRFTLLNMVTNFLYVFILISVGFFQPFVNQFFLFKDDTKIPFVTHGSLIVYIVLF